MDYPKANINQESGGDENAAALDKADVVTIISDPRQGIKARTLEGFIPADPLDMPIQHHTQTMRQIGVIQPNKLLYLHEFLNQVCNKVAYKKMEVNSEDASKIKNTDI